MLSELTKVQKNMNFVDVLEREVMRLNDDIDFEAIRSASKSCKLSWRVIRAENTEFVVQRLQNSFNLTKSRSIMLYDEIKSNDPKVLQLQTNNRITAMHSNLYLNFVSKCMFV